MTYKNKYEAIISVFDVSRKVIDNQQVFSPLDVYGDKDVDTDAVISNNTVNFSTNKVYMLLEDETTSTDRSIIKVDLASTAVTKTPTTDADAIRLCASLNKTCRVDMYGDVYDLATETLHTNIPCTDPGRISASMDDSNNGVVYLNDAGTEVISKGTTTKTYTLDTPVILGSGEIFGLTGNVLIYAATYFSPTRRILSVFHE
jgi:hypothetical protein